MSGERPGLVLFPGVGSFGGELRALLRTLRPAARMARYPGRIGADAESFDEVVESCATQVRRQARGRPVLVGHSFGAYVAYATARKLEQLGTGISNLVVAAAAAPGLLSVPDSAVRDRPGIAAFLDGIVDEPPREWGDPVLDAVAQDLRLLREFSESAYGKVRCPILAARGAADPVTSTGGIREWAGVTTSWCAHKVFPGGHSDWLSSPQFASWVRQNSLPVLEPDPSGGP